MIGRITGTLLEKNPPQVLVDVQGVGYEIDVPMHQLTEMIGEDAAAACYKAGIKAIKKLSRLVSNLKLECGFEKKQSLYVAHNKML